MMVGAVSPDGEAIIPLRVRGPRGMVTGVSTVIDTGFDAWLTLPRPAIEALGLSLREEGRYTLGDGSRASSRFFTAEVEWFGRWRRMLVLELSGDPLIGMALLRGSHLGMDVSEGGRVEIRPLSI